MCKRRLRLLGGLMLILVPGIAAAVSAPTSYTLVGWTADGGGGTSGAPGYLLNGTIGQPDAGVLSGGGYILGGGFWPGGVASEPPEFCIYLPSVVRND